MFVNSKHVFWKTTFKLIDSCHYLGGLLMCVLACKIKLLVLLR